jgi:hypothetical protein
VYKFPNVIRIRSPLLCNRSTVSPPPPLNFSEHGPGKKQMLHFPAISVGKKMGPTLQCCIVLGVFIVERHLNKEKMVKVRGAYVYFILLLILCVGTIPSSTVNG